MKTYIVSFALLILSLTIGCQSPSSSPVERPMTTSGVYTAVVQPGSGYSIIADSIIVAPSNGNFVTILFNIYLDGVLSSPQAVDVSVWTYDLATEEFIVSASGSGKYKGRFSKAVLTNGVPYRFAVSVGTSQNDQTQILTEPIVFQ